VSLDLFVHSFAEGERVPLPERVFAEVFGPYVTVTEPNYRHVTAPDGSGSDIYVEFADGLADGLMLNRFGHGQLLDLLVEFARLTDAVVIVPGSPVCLVDAGQRDHLPDGLADEFDTVVVSDGHGIVDSMV
jgi:hypothetical protein